MITRNVFGWFPCVHLPFKLHQVGVRLSLHCIENIGEPIELNKKLKKEENFWPVYSMNAHYFTLTGIGLPKTEFSFHFDDIIIQKHFTGRLLSMAHVVVHGMWLFF